MTTLFSGTVATPTPAPKRKRSLLPVLTIVFLVSYALMTFLIVEQGSAIQQQHNLIQVLMADSMELWSMKGKAIADKAAQDRAHAGTPSTTQNPSGNNTPSTKVPSTQAPSTPAPQQHTQSRASKDTKSHIQLPPVPASDLGDQRRVLITL